MSALDIDLAIDTLFAEQGGEQHHTRKCCENRVMEVAEIDFENEYDSTTAFLSERAGYDLDALCNGDCLHA